jgi:hypothetical protein
VCFNLELEQSAVEGDVLVQVLDLFFSWDLIALGGDPVLDGLFDRFVGLFWCWGFL